MEPALRNRLLGAAVLIALAVIFVPMFLSGGSNKPPGEQSVSLKIPGQPDAQLQTKTLSVGPDRASATAPNAAANDPDHVATVDLDGSKPAAASTAAVQPAPQPAANAAASGAQPAAQSPQVPPPPSAASQAVTNAVPPPAPSQVAPAPAGPLPGGAGAAANGVYALNLGLYIDRANADKLVARVRALGLPTQIANATYQGKAATRVSAGPFADRAAAEAARLKLKAAAFGVQVALAAGAATQTVDAPATAIASDRAGAFAVQIGAFGTQAEAQKLRDRLRALGFDGYVDDIATDKGKLWRVRAGPVNDRAAAEQLRAQIAARMQISGMIVTQS